METFKMICAACLIAAIVFSVYPMITDHKPPKDDTP